MFFPIVNYTPEKTQLNNEFNSPDQYSFSVQLIQKLYKKLYTAALDDMLHHDEYWHCSLFRLDIIDCKYELVHQTCSSTAKSFLQQMHHLLPCEQVLWKNKSVRLLEII